jgi:hypothetical protein
MTHLEYAGGNPSRPEGEIKNVACFRGKGLFAVLRD